jgi:hypothetical protein
MKRRIQKVRGSRLTSRYILILFIHATPRTKIRGLLIDVMLHPYTFYMRSTAYKKQGALDWHPVISLYFLDVQRRIQKARGSDWRPDSIYYTFYTLIVIDSKLMLSVVFIHNNHRRMKSMKHLYVYIHQSGNQQNHFIQVYKLTTSLLQLQQGLPPSSDSLSTEKLYWDTKYWVVSYTLSTSASRSSSLNGKSVHSFFVSRSDMWLFNSAMAWATAEEFTAKEEKSRLDNAFWADSNSCSWALF